MFAPMYSFDKIGAERILENQTYSEIVGEVVKARRILNHITDPDLVHYWRNRLSDYKFALDMSGYCFKNGIEIAPSPKKVIHLIEKKKRRYSYE